MGTRLSKLIENRRKWLHKNRIQDWNNLDTIFIATKFSNELVSKRQKEIEDWLMVNTSLDVKKIVELKEKFKAL